MGIYYMGILIACLLSGNPGSPTVGSMAHGLLGGPVRWIQKGGPCRIKEGYGGVTSVPGALECKIHKTSGRRCRTL